MVDAIHPDAGQTVLRPEPLRMSRTYPVRAALLFKAWTTPEHLGQFFAPSPYTVPGATIDLRIGGRFDVGMRSPEGVEHWSRGTIVELVPARRLMIDFDTFGSDDQCLFRARTELDFVEVAEGTRLDVTQSYTVFDAEKVGPMIAGAPGGWAVTLDQLYRVVLGLGEQLEPLVRSIAHGSFHIERSYDAPIGRVWKALTDQAAKDKWFAGPDDWHVIERTMDVREGGTERARGRFGSGMVSTFDAIYHDVVPNERLVYSYVMHIDDRKISASLATIELSALASGTRILVTEHGAFLDGYDDAGSRERGTVFLLDALGASLAD